MPWFTGWTSPWLAVGRHHDGSPWSAQMTVPGLQAADDPHYFYLDGLGTLFFGPCGPGGGPYGRREHGPWTVPTVGRTEVPARERG